MDERLNALAGADDLSVAVLVLVVHLPPLGVVVGERGEAPEDGPGEELDQLGHDGDVVDDLRVGGHGAHGEPRVEHVRGVGVELAQHGEEGAGEGVHL